MGIWAFLFWTVPCKVGANSLNITMNSRLACSSSEASKFKKLCRRTINSHDRALKELKEELHAYLPDKKKSSYKKTLQDVAEDSHHRLGQ